MKEEYILKLTETEAKAICHGFGKCGGNSPIVHEIYYSLIEEIYKDDHSPYYNESRRLKSGRFLFFYGGR